MTPLGKVAKVWSVIVELLDVDLFELLLGCLGYPAPTPRSSYPALGPQPHKSLNELNLLLFKKSSRYDHVHINFNGVGVI